MNEFKNRTLKASISEEELYSKEPLPFGADQYALLVSESIRRDEDKRILKEIMLTGSTKTTPGRVYSEALDEVRRIMPSTIVDDEVVGVSPMKAPKDIFELRSKYDGDRTKSTLIESLDDMCDCECHDLNGRTMIHCAPCCSRTYEKRSC